MMPGLGLTAGRAFVEGMQRINVAIPNGWFALAFGGAPVLGGAAVALHWRGEARTALPWIVAGGRALRGVAADHDGAERVAQRPAGERR